VAPTGSRHKPTLAIIGAGRLGTAIAIALERAGYRIETLVANSQVSANRSAKLLDVPPLALAAKGLHRLRLTDIIIISTPDDYVAETATALLKVEKTSSQRCVVLHTSGALSSAVLRQLKRRKWSVGSLHPIISVSSRKASIAGAFWSIEGDQKSIRVAKELVNALNGKSFTVNSEKKPLYHAAALMSAGGVVALFDVALGMMIQSGVDRKTARKVLQPLIQSVVESLGNKDTDEALTGTFSRGDIKTVVQHLEALHGRELDVARQLYRILGKESLKLASLETEVVKKIEKLLSGN
jgi:predicted short-subunit dehydrogenase-like oxidoreductase (DUF2520 family)